MLCLGLICELNLTPHCGRGSFRKAGLLPSITIQQPHRVGGEPGALTSSPSASGQAACWSFLRAGWGSEWLQNYRLREVGGSKHRHASLYCSGGSKHRHASFYCSLLVALQRRCIFLQTEGKVLHQQKDQGSLY